MTTTSPAVTAATDQLVAALASTKSLRGFRVGLLTTVAYTEQHADPADPAHAEALDVLSVWQALDNLAAMVEIEGGLING
ncbi:hypothetical protein KLP28_01740 [Nocardioidaceae bacterium]|nr:hypothetical protein KLP28_01740 [Nocardioidaceae bacterium]